MTPLFRNPRSESHLAALAMIVAVWAVLQFCLAVSGPAAVMAGDLIDTDSYMRLIRVEQLLNGGDWFDNEISRSNAPFGETLHWTRPFDLLLLGGTALLQPLLGQAEALHWSGVLVSPVLQLLAGLAFLWATAPLARGNLWYIAVPVLFVQTAFMSYSSAGRADHHTLQVLCFILLIGFTLRFLAAPGRAGPALAAGLVAGFGLWISIEAFLPLAGTLAALSLAWLLTPAGRARQGVWLGLGLVAVIALAIAVERPPGDWLVVSYDKISMVHLVVGLLVLCVWSAAALGERWSRSGAGAGDRLLVLGLGGLLCLSVLYVGYPEFLRGPMVDVDPRIKPIWMSRVSELEPLLPNDWVSFGRFVYFLGASLITVPYLLWLLASERDPGRRLLWLSVACALAFALPVALVHLRFALYPEVLFVVIAGDLLDRSRQWTQRRAAGLLPQAAHGLLLAVLLVGSVGFGSAIKSRAEAHSSSVAADPECRLSAIAGRLNDPALVGPGPQTILAITDLGPELLYRTPHRVIATPYHRNGDGIFDGHFMLASSDDAAIRRLMALREVDLVLLCPRQRERAYFAGIDEASGPSLYRRLLDGPTPAWVTPLPLKAEGPGSAFRLFAVAP